jgi:hypothetical protein
MGRDAAFRGPRWSGWLLPGALLAIAAVVLVATLASQVSPVVEPSLEPSPTPGDEHEVATDEGVVSFRYDGASIVVRLAKDGTTAELVRVDLPFMASAPPGGTETPTGTALFAMVCDRAAGPNARRYVFGRFDDASEVEYSGPDAIGKGASDGLFLFGAPAGSDRWGRLHRDREQTGWRTRRLSGIDLRAGGRGRRPPAVRLLRDRVTCVGPGPRPVGPNRDDVGVGERA